jgi:hypothetical protein
MTDAPEVLELCDGVRLLTNAELAELVRSTPAAVARWRGRGTGPPWIRVGRRCLYREKDVLAWLDERAQDREHEMSR